MSTMAWRMNEIARGQGIAAGAIGADEIEDASVDSADLAASAVKGAEIDPGAWKTTLIDGGTAGDHTVTGIATDDHIKEVLHYTSGALTADLTSQFSISAADTINNDGGTDTSGDKLLVRYINHAD